ncbi:hypothetical protein ZOSMA_5G00170 [Zostera marina]|uniref:Uncharacterized protein n=1 Tax=Zostera marina TaxID=29655 RepID=A0A0K9NTQ3_ZOSMR|nr:hypothetical protein ZOSMA_5G00170 [Zostera marina]
MSSEIISKLVLEELTIQIVIEFQNRSFKPEDPILCKIPKTIRANHEKEYEPEIIAIGPYHRNGDHLGKINPRLQFMEDMKLKFLIDLCITTANKIEGVTKEDILKNITIAVQEKAIDAYKKYSESISFVTSYNKDFLKMLILDGSFIVQLFIEGGIPMKFTQNAHHSVKRDLLLFENQIPFFILETIYTCCFPTFNAMSFKGCALSYLQFPTFKDSHLENPNIESVNHLLHLCHICIMYKSPEGTNEESEKLMTIPTASLLKEHGIQFRKKEDKRYGINSFLDISFKNGIIEIPHVVIEDNTSSIYRNLLAFEQSSQTDHGNKFTHVNFMNDLIDTVDDVTLLTKTGILGNNLGSVDEVTKLFKEMCNYWLGVDRNHHYLVEV